MYAPVLQRVRQVYAEAAQRLPADADHIEPIRVLEDWADTRIEGPSHHRLLTSESSSTVCPDFVKLGIQLVVFDCAGTTIDEGLWVCMCVRVMVCVNVISKYVV